MTTTVRPFLMKHGFTRRESCLAPPRVRVMAPTSTEVPVLRFFPVLLALSALAQPAHGPRDTEPADVKAVHDFKLTTDNTDKLLAAGVKMRELAKTDPERQQPGALRGKTIAETVAVIEQHPKYSAAIEDAGLSPREFVTGMRAVVTSAMWSHLLQNHPEAKPPPDINPDNIAFVRSHPELIEKWHAAMGNDREVPNRPPHKH